MNPYVNIIGKKYPGVWVSSSGDNYSDLVMESGSLSIPVQSDLDQAILDDTADISISPIIDTWKARVTAMALNEGIWAPPGNATTTPGIQGLTPPSTSGTATARSVATTNYATRMRRLGYVSSTTAGSFAAARISVAQITCNSGTPGDGSGFTLIERWVESDPAVVAGRRSFVGVSSSTASPSNVEPSTLLNSVGIGQLSTDATQWYWIQGGSAGQTAVPIGTRIGAPAGNSTTAWELSIYCPDVAANTYYMQLINLSAGIKAVRIINGSASVIPQSNMLLAWRHWACNNATAAAVSFDLCSLYISTDR